MRVTPLVVPAVCLSLMMVSPRTVMAQTELGVFGGHLMDQAWSGSLRFGAEGRLPIPRSPLVLQPRISDQPGTSGGPATLQVDVNLLYQAPAAEHWPIAPYVGVGAGYNHFGSYNGVDFTEPAVNKLVGNFVAGFRLNLNGNPPITPFVNSEYSFAKQFTNPYAIEIGVLYALSRR
jgi:hypothetical protein